MSKETRLSPAVKELVKDCSRAVYKKERFHHKISRALAREKRSGIGKIGLVEELNPFQIAQLQYDLRELVDDEFGFNYPTHWTDPQSPWKRDISELLDAAELACPGASIFISVCRIGHVREQAVRKLQFIQGAFSLALLLQRLNDWVPEVRQAAAEKIEEFLDRDVLSRDFLQSVAPACLELLVDDSRYGRMEADEFAVLERIRDRMSIWEILPEFILLEASDRSPRIVRLGLRKGALHGSLPRMAVEAKHARTRAIALSALLAGKFHWRQDKKVMSVPVSQNDQAADCLAHGLRDDSLQVRKIALLHLSGPLGKKLDREAIYRAFMRSGPRSMREISFSGLRGIGFDLLEEGRARIKSGAPTEMDCILLGRYGTAEDASLLFEAAHPVTTATGFEALRAAAELGHREATSQLIEIMLRGTDVKRARQASKTLYQLDEIIPFSQICRALDDRVDFTGRAVFRFARRLPLIQMLLFFLMLIDRNIPVDEGNFWKWARAKRANAMFNPREEDLLALDRLLDRLPSLRKKTEQCLGFHLKSRQTVSAESLYDYGAR